MKHSMHQRVRILFLTAVFCAFAAVGYGYDVTEKLSISGVMSGVFQYQSLDENPPGFDDSKGRGAFPFQPEFSFRPTENDEIFAKFGFAAGNGLNPVSPFVFAPWAADLEDDVKNINGRNRDYLLTAWYKHTFAFSEHHSLGVTGGIIDSTDYVDENAFANDEYTQFMNEALVNGPNGFLPSFDLGGALEWEINDFSAKLVYMNIGENDDGKGYGFGAMQFAYRLETGMGEGNYRIIIDGTTEDFSPAPGENQGEDSDDSEYLGAVTLSFDQQLGEVFGAWIRFGWQRDDAAIDYRDLYSGGINIVGSPWGRGDDNIGIGYAFLNNGNLDIDNTNVLELYYRFQFNEYLSLTGDIQYMRDKYNTAVDEDPADEGTDSAEGWIFGVRATVEF